MIRNENEYKEAVRRLREEAERYEKYRSLAKERGLNEEEVGRMIEPLLSYHLELQEEIDSYERLKRGEFGELQNLQGLGHILVGLRIARGLSQRQLAKQLDVSESQVSRDERNEYHGITVERATRILDALGVRLTSRLEEPVSPIVPNNTDDDSGRHASA